MKVESINIKNTQIISTEKIDRHIEIVSSTVGGLSSMSKQSRESIFEVLSEHYTNVGITIVNNLKDLQSLTQSNPDVVFLGMKYLPLNPREVRGPNKLWLTDYLSRRGISCTGSDHNAHRLEIDKSLAKQRVSQTGLKTSSYFVIKQEKTDDTYKSLPFPLFVKPTNRGGGEGIDSSSVVNDRAALWSKANSIRQALQADSLVEQYLPGREFSVAILKDESSNIFLTFPVELIASTDKNGMRLLSNDVKRSNSEVVSAVDDKKLHDKLCAFALASFEALGARDYGRIDIRLDKNGEPNFLEANLMPSLIENYGSFPKACMLNVQLDYKSIILSIAELALKRQEDLSQSKPSSDMSYSLSPVFLGAAD